MASSHFQWSVSKAFIPEVEAAFSPSTKHGADIRFHGVVRDEEDGKPLQGIDYSYYPAMVENCFEALGEKLAAEHPDHFAQIHHRIGYVPAGEASIIIRVQTKHSRAGFEISQAYLAEIKKSVPIWKEPIFA